MGNGESEYEKLYKSLENSLVGYEVNGNPGQRMWALRTITSWILLKRRLKQGKKTKD